ncbi:MAG TPA: fibrinogen-like YCDxxxxGGGW domain-containing protein, partial [Polyangiales bacterium]|nr:fibrinogen-like YCDxxxxGGGW domain-containing protein [Polyangiales bacterium]
STAPRDFTNPLTYTVTAADGSTKSYTVTVKVARSSAKEIIDFVILGSSGQVDDSTITLTVPYAATLTSLTPTIVHSGVKLVPASGVVRDFSDPVQYVVTAANGSTRTYTVIVKRAKSSDNSITQFTLLNTDAQVVSGSISVTLPFGTDVSSVAPQITHTGASIEPAVGELADFRVERIYTVTAANGDTRQYTVHVTIAPSNATTITHFELLGRQAQIEGTAITLTLPHGSIVTSLAPDIMHTGASVEPAETEARDFSQPVTYVVRAANNSTATYTVTVTVAQADARAITGFTILNRPAPIGVGGIALTVPFDTDLSDLTPTIQITGASITPGSGVAQDFRQPVTYTVTAQNGATRRYVVTVTEASNSAKGLSNFEIFGKTATIDGNAVDLTLPYGTDRSLLTPTFMASGVNVQPPSGMSRSFTTPVMYRVTAADNSFTDYNVTVTNAQNDARDITGFTVENVSGDIGTDTVSVRLPYNTTLTSLAPQIAFSGASVFPPGNVPRDFTEPRTYAVTAADGSMKTYTVTVTSAAHPIDCRELLFTAPATTSGVYTIDPDGSGAIAPFSVYCDMSAHGGGWTLIGKTAAGDYTALSNNDFLNLIVNPGNDVNASLLQSAAVPNTGDIGFYNKAKTNALYHASGAPRAVRVDMSNHQAVPAANITFFQQRVSAPANWDFWLALRNAKLWNRDGSAMAAPDDEFVAHFGVDFVLTNRASDFNVATNVVRQRGNDNTYSFDSIYEHTLPDGTTKVEVSRHLGLLNDGVGNLEQLWLLTADPTDVTHYKQDTATRQKALIWLR